MEICKPWNSGHARSAGPRPTSSRPSHPEGLWMKLVLLRPRPPLPSTGAVSLIDGRIFCHAQWVTTNLALYIYKMATRLDKLISRRAFERKDRETRANPPYRSKRFTVPSDRIVHHYWIIHSSIIILLLCNNNSVTHSVKF